MNIILLILLIILLIIIGIVLLPLIIGLIIISIIIYIIIRLKNKITGVFKREKKEKEYIDVEFEVEDDEKRGDEEKKRDNKAD